MDVQTAIMLLDKPSAAVPELEQAVITLAGELRHQLIIGPDGVAEEAGVDALEIEAMLCRAVERLEVTRATLRGLADAA